MVVTIEVVSQNQGIQLFSSVLVPLSEPITVVPIGRRAYMLSDAALDPLYS